MKRWEHRFQVKAGRWVFVPTPHGRACGEEIRAKIASAWSPPAFYFHFQRGGHLAALRAHSAGKYFFKCDIEDFFGSINLSRVTRSLKRHFPYVEARSMAASSVVFLPGTRRTMLPYGFVQSPIIASLALDASRIGSYLRNLAANAGVSVSVYMDDIVISAQDLSILNSIQKDLKDRSDKAGIPLNPEKSEGPSDIITAFNVDLSHNSLSISRRRMREFGEALSAASSYAAAMGIIGYVASVNTDQLDELISSVDHRSSSEEQ